MLSYEICCVYGQQFYQEGKKKVDIGYVDFQYYHESNPKFLRVSAVEDIQRLFYAMCAHHPARSLPPM